MQIKQNPKFIVQHIFKIYMTLYIHHLFMFILDSMRTVSNDLMWAQTYDKWIDTKK